MTQKFYTDAAGNYLGSFDGSDPPAGAIEVPTAPPINGQQKWSGGDWQPPGVPTIYTLSKATAWRRMTPEEAAQIDAIMMETDAQLRQIYLAAQYLSTGDDLWQTLYGIIQGAIGTTRANAILAPES